MLARNKIFWARFTGDVREFTEFYLSIHNIRCYFKFYRDEQTSFNPVLWHRRTSCYNSSTTPWSGTARIFRDISTNNATVSRWDLCWVLFGPKYSWFTQILTYSTSTSWFRRHNNNKTLTGRRELKTFPNFGK